MKSQLKFALLVALGTGVLSAGAAAQQPQINAAGNGRMEYEMFIPGQAAQLQQVGWDDHHRCDGDHDRDDRGCYYRDGDGYRYRYPAYYGNGYWSNGYYVEPAPGYRANTGWYDRDERWHAYDRDRDRDRRRHDDDDDRR